MKFTRTIGKARPEMVNCIAGDDGAIVRLKPFGNAVVVQIFPREPGEPDQKVVSIMCRDPEMEPALLEEARRLFPDL